METASFLGAKMLVSGRVLLGILTIRNWHFSVGPEERGDACSHELGEDQEFSYGFRAFSGVQKIYTKSKGLTAGFTYSYHPFREENDLNQTSIFSRLNVSGVTSVPLIGKNPYLSVPNHESSNKVAVFLSKHRRWYGQINLGCFFFLFFCHERMPFFFKRQGMMDSLKKKVGGDYKDFDQ